MKYTTCRWTLTHSNRSTESLKTPKSSTWLTLITLSWLVNIWTFRTIHFWIALNFVSMEAVLRTLFHCIKKEHTYLWLYSFTIHHKAKQHTIGLNRIDSQTMFLTKDIASWGTHFYKCISPCIHNTMVFKRRTGVWDPSTVLPCSCLSPCLLWQWTSLHFLDCLTRINTSITILQCL